MTDQSDNPHLIRTMAQEIWRGMPVAAYRWLERPMGRMRFARHWAYGPEDAERLFTEADVEQVWDRVEEANARTETAEIEILSWKAETAMVRSKLKEAARMLEAWAWLAEHKNIELAYGYGDPDDDDGRWEVHRRHGGVNDREWKLIATGRTPLEAVQNAQQALNAGSRA